MANGWNVTHGMTFNRARCILARVGITKRTSSLEYGSRSLEAAGVNPRLYWRYRMIARAIRRVYW